MLIALSCFLLGDLILINTYSGNMYSAGMLFFVIGKLFYAIRFSNTRDFKLSRLLPFLFLCFIYILWMMNLIYDNLGALFFPILIYFFAAIIVLQMAFLRKIHKTTIMLFYGISQYLVVLGITKEVKLPSEDHQKEAHKYNDSSTFKTL